MDTRIGPLDALPPYLGGKRRIAPLLFAELDRHMPRASWGGLHLLDPMCGGGAVALSAKASGFAVTASDIAERGALVARALVANDAVRLRPVDLVPLFGDGEDTPEREVPGLTSAQSRWFSRALAAADRRPEPRRSLLRLLCMTTDLRAFPMSLPSASDAGYAAEDDFDHVSARRLGHYLRARRALTPRSVGHLAERLNAGVFGGRGRALMGDARDVLAEEQADVVVLAPPYPGTTRYERAYAALDALLGDDGHRAPAPTLDELLDAASGAKWVLLTYGGHGVTLGGLVATVARHRKVVSAVAVPYPHLYAIAKEKNRVSNHEHVVIARR